MDGTPTDFNVQYLHDNVCVPDSVEKRIETHGPSQAISMFHVVHFGQLGRICR